MRYSLIVHFYEQPVEPNRLESVSEYATCPQSNDFDARSIEDLPDRKLEFATSHRVDDHVILSNRKETGPINPAFPEVPHRNLLQ